jgi:hypothetical protein
MTVKFSIAHLTVLGTTPLDLIHIAADAGYDYVSIRMTPVADGEHVTPLAGIRAWSAASRSASPTPASKYSMSNWRGSVLMMSRTSTAGVLEAAAGIGAQHVLAQLNDPDRDRATERFGRLCDLALEFSLTVDLEFPSWSETGDLAAAAAVVRDVDRSNAGILVDVLHFFRSNSSIETVGCVAAGVVPFSSSSATPPPTPPDGGGRDPHRPFARAFVAGVWPPSVALNCSLNLHSPGPTRWRSRTMCCVASWVRPNTPASSWRPAREVVADRGLPAMAR